MKRALTSAAVLLTMACGPSQECRDYVQCQQAVDKEVDVTAWDEGGSCWDLPSTARACTAVCREALLALRELPDAPAACR
jgi:hypothetical protein